ncbi:MAG: diaminopimelate decarboxylase [Planctomycetaceae bacterium TMED10]|nr:MAG: diaminopimelate decarboxylase [Planctomycetaceae bacterium TMED10]
MSAASSHHLLRNQIADIPISQLAAKVNTPFYVYDEQKIIERINDLKAFDVVRYAQKACSNLAILDICRRNGAVVDAVSTGEILRAEAVGFSASGDPSPIVYTADIFDLSSLELVLDRGIHTNCGSPDMLTQLGQKAPGRSITLRINPGFGHGHNQKTNTGGSQSKHGIWHSELTDCLRIAEKYNLRVTGLHMHIGSGTDLEHLAQVVTAMEQAAREVGSSLDTISAGGGLPIPYQTEESYVDLEAYFQLWDAARKRLESQFGHSLRLEIEPGRYLVAEAGFLVAEIRAIKKMDKNWFYLVDAGFNDLARPILYGSHHPMTIYRRSAEKTNGLREVIVGGPLCESGDIFTQKEGGFVCTRSLPEAQLGDLLIIECAGAYGAVMGSNYNSKPLAAELLVRDGQVFTIRERQTFAQMTAAEHIPD